MKQKKRCIFWGVLLLFMFFMAQTAHAVTIEYPAGIKNAYTGEVTGFTLPLSFVEAFIIFALAILVLVLITLFYIRLDKPGHFKIGKEPYPEQSLDPAKMAYILEGSITSKKLYALLFHWANKGYISIEGELEPDYKIHQIYKVTTITGVVDDYERLLFDKLFEKRESIAFSSIGNVLSRVAEDAKNNIEQKMQSEMYQATSVRRKRASRLLLLLPVFMLQLFRGGSLLLVILPTIAFYLASIIVFEYAAKKEIFLSKGQIILQNVLGYLLLFASFGINIFGRIGDNYNGLWIDITIYIAMLLSIFMATHMLRYTAYGKKVSLHTAAYRNDMLTVSEEKLRSRLLEDTTYFYDNLPYAYALGIERVFADKFETMDVLLPAWYQPVWYEKANAQKVFISPRLFAEAMDKSLKAIKPTKGSLGAEHYDSKAGSSPFGPTGPVGGGGGGGGGDAF